MLDLLVENRQQKGELDSTHLRVSHYHIFLLTFFQNWEGGALEHGGVDESLHALDTLDQLFQEFTFQKFLHGLTLVNVGSNKTFLGVLVHFYFN